MIEAAEENPEKKRLRSPFVYGGQLGWERRLITAPGYLLETQTSERCGALISHL